MNEQEIGAVAHPAAHAFVHHIFEVLHFRDGSSIHFGAGAGSLGLEIEFERLAHAFVAVLGQSDGGDLNVGAGKITLGRFTAIVEERLLYHEASHRAPERGKRDVRPDPRKPVFLFRLRAQTRRTQFRFGGARVGIKNRGRDIGERPRRKNGFAVQEIIEHRCVGIKRPRCNKRVFILQRSLRSSAQRAETKCILPVNAGRASAQ